MKGRLISHGPTCGAQSKGDISAHLFREKQKLKCLALLQHVRVYCRTTVKGSRTTSRDKELVLKAAEMLLFLFHCTIVLTNSQLSCHVTVHRHKTLLPKDL